ncbi:MAG TPA: DUF6443 domain-containing protein [Chitinophaga sp.]|uniref:DUF6443 domain-containing protein n=1 Tax=Chitinophaga sp. TaxID=1869181 RepID=UPI002D0D2175|nr:DUF6443 domain-containing protein [Chitinophaga sp.]HVI46815.1 DUF6443 domain-containing protein [Chitinophaga sp.]
MQQHRKFIQSLILTATTISISIAGMGQNIPDTSGRSPATSVTAPPLTCTCVLINFIRSWRPLAPMTDTAQVTASTDVAAVQQQTRYFDGLGRLVQTVSRGISPAGRDMVQPVVYDAFGREAYRYLPYVPQSSNISDGKLKLNPFNNQRQFYMSATLNPGVSGDSVFYTETEFEPSPLNRVRKSFAPGNTWSRGGGYKPMEMQYLVNNALDAVRIWDIPSGSMIPTSVPGKVYPPGDLLKNVAKDENGNRIIEFRDKQNRVILKRVELADNATDGHNGWLNTYYVYTDRGNLHCVIPPKAVQAISSAGWAIDSMTAAELCYFYRYDQRDRMIIKKIPGADSVEMVYDVRNRLAFMRDGNLKDGGNWLATFYDALDRPTATALYASKTTRQPLADSLKNEIGISIPGQALTYLTYTYFDAYNFPGVASPLSGDFSKPQAGSNPYAEPVTGVSSMTMGMETGSRVRILNTNQWLTTTTYYNNKGRPVQIIRDNATGGKETITSLYDFSGKVLSTYLRHTNPHSSLTPQTTILTSFTYDPAGRLTGIKKKLNDTTVERTVSALAYNELGQLKTKRLGVTGSSSQLETMTYEYNVRGWLKNINKGFVNTTGSASNWFGQDLSYEYGFKTNQFNGNIAGVRWKDRNDGFARAYGYSYDNPNRLTTADFTQQNASGTGWTRDIVDFTMSGVAYDPNGNILSMKQKGLKGTTVRTIDSLVYVYIPNSNKLFYVTDSANDPQSTLGDFIDIPNGTNQDYVFDRNGNTTIDINRQMITKYNILNRPDSITLLGKGILEFSYDATGNKLGKKITDYTGTGRIINYDYIGGFLYKNDTLVEIPQDEGRIRVVYKTGAAPSFYYDYFVKDYLGNVRSMLTEQTDFSVYAATMEADASGKENALFANIDATRSPKPVGYPGAENNRSVAKLNARSGEHKIGPSLVLRVMAGDTIQISTHAFYKSVQPAEKNNSKSADRIVLSLAQTLRTPATAGDIHQGIDNTNTYPQPITSSDIDHLKSTDKNRDFQNLRPKAYLNFALFDDRFKLVDEHSGVKQVGENPDKLQTLGTDRMIISKTGFLYVFTSNESQQDVFFDNLVVTKGSGPLLESYHYYPFGLTMAGLSFSALQGNNYPENKLRYNNKELQNREFANGSGLEMYDYGARMYDPQIGRWSICDQLAEKYDAWSPYHFVFNNPIRNIDPNGKEIINSNPKGSDNYERTQNALLILQRTNPEAYRILNETSVKVYVSIGKLNLSERYDKSYIGNFTNGITEPDMRVPTSFRVTNVLNTDGNPVSAEIEGNYLGQERLERDALGIDPKSKRIYTSEEADKLISIQDMSVRIDESITDLKKFTTVLGHEFGHAQYAVQNKSEAWKWGELDNATNSLNPGHKPGNPSGKLAHDEENKTGANYSNAWKQITSEIIQYLNASRL